MGKRSAPPAPDYQGAAQTQGAANVQTAIANNLMGRPNEVTPYGSRTWKQIKTQTIPGSGGNPDVQVPLFESRESFTPLGQERFDQEQRIIGGLGNVAESNLGRVGAAQEQPFDMSQVGARPTLPKSGGPMPLPGAGRLPGITQIPNQSNIGDTLYQQQTRYLDPQFTQQRDMLENKLTNQGLQRGTQAFDTAMRNQSMDQERAYADARDRAILASGAEQSRQFGLGAEQFGQGLARQGQQFGQGADTFRLGLAGQGQQFGQEADVFRLGQGARQQDIAEQAWLRQLPLNELNALRTGSQVGLPNFQPFVSSGAQPAPYAQATQLAGDYSTDAANLQSTQRGQTMGAIGSVAGAGLAAFMI